MMMNNGAEPIVTVSLESPGEPDLSVVNLDATTRDLLYNGGPLTGINSKTSAISKVKQNFWTELPQMVVVETRFITEQIAAQRCIYSAQTLLPIPDKKCKTTINKSFSQIATQTPPSQPRVDAASTVKPDTIDAAVTADSSNPYRDRSIQTTKIAKKTENVGIQCNIEDHLAFAEISINTNVIDERKLSDKEEFLIFSREKSIFYLNGRRECMVCGEIETSMDRMLSHLAIHWGPSTLCHLCGLKFEHQVLMSKHHCKIDKDQVKSKKKRKSYKQCPIFWCGSVSKSKHALNRHLSQHISCIQRRRPYVTFALERTMVLIRPRNLMFNSSHRCNICMRLCKNSTIFFKHRKRCVASFIARLKKKIC